MEIDGMDRDYNHFKVVFNEATEKWEVAEYGISKDTAKEALDALKRRAKRVKVKRPPFQKFKALMPVNGRYDTYGGYNKHRRFSMELREVEVIGRASGNSTKVKVQYEYQYSPDHPAKQTYTDSVEASNLYADTPENRAFLAEIESCKEEYNKLKEEYTKLNSSLERLEEKKEN